MAAGQAQEIAGDEPTEQTRAIEEQLDRVIRSATFRQADRLKRFLEFVVQETIGGRGGNLKEYVIGLRVFKKHMSFDPRTDPIVRVQARRLRAKLELYYANEGLQDALIIELPRGGYAPVFKQRTDPDPSPGEIARSIPGKNTIAIQEFEDLNASPELASFGRGVREELIHRLSRLPWLRVIETTRSDSVDGDDLHSQHAAVLIKGTVRRAGNLLRISVHMLDSQSSSYVWSASIDGDLNDPFAAQDSVAAAVVEKFTADFSSDRPAGGFARPLENLSAQNLYVQGRYHLNQRTEESLRKALDFFEKAIAEDGQFALAQSGLADAYALLGHYGVMGPADVWTKATSLAVSAVELDEHSAEARTSLAHAKATQDWDWSGAELEFQRALALNPRYATAHHWYATSCLAPLGRLDEALSEMRIAQEIDPVSSIVARDLAVMHFYRREYDAALDQCDHTIELNPYFAPAYWTLGCIQEQRGDLDESAAAFQRAEHLSPKTPRMLGAISRALALSGRRNRALEIFHELETIAKERYVSPLEFAWICFALGDVDTGFAWVSKAFDDRSFDLLSMNVDPRWDPWRDDARFRSLLGRLHLA
jgi:TolB-like protein/Tfp pilus assembly protein PilF